MSKTATTPTPEVEAPEPQPIFSFEIHPSVLLGMAVFQSPDETRFVLCSTLFEIRSGSLNLIATDGRRIGLYETHIVSDTLWGTLPEHLDFSIDLAPVAKLPKVKKLPAVTVRVYAKHAEVQADRYTVKAPFICREGGEVFPNWRQCIPQEEPTATEKIKLNIDLLSTFGAASKLFNKRHNPDVELFMRGAGHAVTVRMLYVPQFRGVIMPLREDKEESAE
jgi:hypothetical protein